MLAESIGDERDGGALALDGGRARASSRASRGTRSEGRAACAWPPTTRSARSSAPSTRLSRSAGFDVEWREDLPLPLAGRYPAALFHPPDGVLQPARFVRGLARRAAAAGVEIHEHTRVESLDQTAADTVVVATDGYPSGLLGELEGLVVPTRGQVIATEPIDELLFEIPHYGRHGFDYWHQRPDGRIVAGGFRDVSLDSEFTDEEVLTAPVQEALERFVEAHVGRPLRVDYRWAGIFGMVFDFLPVVGRVPGQEDVWIAGGYSGHGNVLGFACGRLVARAVLGERDPLLALFEPARLLGVALDGPPTRQL